MLSVLNAVDVSWLTIIEKGDMVLLSIGQPSIVYRTTIKTSSDLQIKRHSGEKIEQLNVNKYNFLIHNKNRRYEKNKSWDRKALRQ